MHANISDFCWCVAQELQLVDHICGAFKPAVFRTFSKPLSHWACTNVQRNKTTMNLTRLSQNWYLRVMISHSWLELGVGRFVQAHGCPSYRRHRFEGWTGTIWLCLLPADHALRSFACQRPTAFRCPSATFSSQISHVAPLIQ
jgi:hypothetical protein